MSFCPNSFFRRSYLTADNEDRPGDCFRHRKTDFPVASSKNASEVLHTSMTHDALQPEGRRRERETAVLGHSGHTGHSHG